MISSAKLLYTDIRLLQVFIQAKAFVSGKVQYSGRRLGRPLARAALTMQSQLDKANNGAECVHR